MRRAHYLKHAIRPNHDLVFPSQIGTPKAPSDFSWKYSHAVKKIGLTGVTFHALRHTHITDLLRRGMPIKAVANRAGHSDVTVTLNTYAHVMPGDDERLAELADETLRVALS